MTELRQTVKTALAEGLIDNVFDESFCKGLLKKHDWHERDIKSLNRVLYSYGIEAKQVLKTDEKVLIINNRYYLKEFKEIESLPGREFHRRQQLWSIPVNTYTTNYLKDKGYNVPEEPEKEVVVAEPVLEHKPYPFQLEGWKKIEEFNGKALLADEPGLGKSLQSLLYLKNHPELRPALMIVPATLKINWVKEMHKWGIHEDYKIMNGMSDKLIDPNIVIMNYDLLDRYMIELSEASFKLVISDECFPAGTMIDTPDGKKPIESIKVGDRVLNASGVGIVKNTFKREVKDLIKLFLSNGSEITCTPNHPIFTEDGWINAEDTLNKIVFGKKNISNLLSSNNKLGVNNVKSKETSKSMQTMWKRFPGMEKRQQFLQHILHREMENGATIYEKENARIICFGKIIGDCKRETQEKSRVSKKYFKKDEREQSYKKPGSSEEDKKTLGRKRAPYNEIKKKRWEWPRNSSASKGFMAGIRREMGNRMSNKNKSRASQWDISTSLQGRHSSCKIKNMDRGRWFESQLSKSKGERQKERGQVNRIRVERIEILKQGSNGRFANSIKKNTKVYNIEVSGHPSYFADGILVHNCHKICNISAQRTRAFKYIMKEVDHLIAISGTPITSRMKQFWVILSILLPDMFSNHQHFLDEYCWSEDGRYNGARNVKKLHEILKSTVMIRRLKKDVLKDLPPKQYQVVLLDINNRQEYTKADRDFINYLKDTEGYAKAKRASFAETLVKMGYLRRLAADGKMNAAIEWIHDFLESGEKLVIFCEHRRVIDKLMDVFHERIVKIDGRDSLKKRDKAVKEFQENDKIKLFEGNRAAQEGITLTAASHLVILEFPWTPGELDQRSDRIHRISQEAKSVNIYYLAAHDTIEERMASIIDKKREVIQGIIDGTEPEHNEFIKYLIDSYKQNY